MESSHSWAVFLERSSASSGGTPHDASESSLGRWYIHCSWRQFDMELLNYHEEDGHHWRKILYWLSTVLTWQHLTFLHNNIMLPSLELNLQNYAHARAFTGIKVKRDRQ